MNNFIGSIVLLILIVLILDLLYEWITIPYKISSISKQLKRIADNLENKS